MSPAACLTVIPARYGSTRFPGKVLAPLGKKTVLQRCWEAALKARLGPVLIATDDNRVSEAAMSWGARTVMTSKACPSGSDRVAQAARSSRTPFILNLQGDEPFVRPESLKKFLSSLRRDRGADIATLAAPIVGRSELRNPNVVKLAMSRSNRALYFSRSAIPFRANGKEHVRPLKHIGIYLYRRRALFRFVKLRPSPLELSERLEQLRALEDGMAISVVVLKQGTISIDTKADLRRAKAFLGSSRRQR